MSRLKHGWGAATLALVLLAGALGAGCTRAQARVVVAPPPLEVPPPPPRLVEPVLAAEVPTVEPVDASLIATTPPTPPPAPEPARTDATRSTDPPPAEAVISPPAPAPASTLQTLPAERELQVQRSIRANLDGALANLNRVDYQRLGADARVNFDQARRFIAQAEEALRSRNFVFAATVADKAATLAAQLAGR